MPSLPIRRALVTLLLLLLCWPGCSSLGSEEECQFDDDCPTGQECDYSGDCRQRQQQWYPPPPGPGPAPPTQDPGGQQCSERTLLDCGCWGPANDQPFAEPACDSGFAQAQLCGGFCPQGGYTYRVRCLCDSTSPAEPPEPGPTTPQTCGSRQWAGALVCRPLTPHARGVMDRLTSFWGEGPRQICHYTTYDQGSTYCGPLAPQNAFYCPGQDVIGFDSVLLDMMYNQVGDIGAVAFLAHEWGHLMQQRLGSQATRGKHMELQADCLSGLFIAWQESQGHFRAMDIPAAFDNMCRIGDPNPSTWFDPNAHGTCQERMNAFSTGYQGGRARMQTLCPNPGQIALQVCP